MSEFDTTSLSYRNINRGGKKIVPPWVSDPKITQYFSNCFIWRDLPVPPWKADVYGVLWDAPCADPRCKKPYEKVRIAKFGSRMCDLHFEEHCQYVRTYYARIACVFLMAVEVRLRTFFDTIADKGYMETLTMGPRVYDLLDKMVPYQKYIRVFPFNASGLVRGKWLSAGQYRDKIAKAGYIMADFYVDGLGISTNRRFDYMDSLEEVIHWACEYIETFTYNA